MPHTNSVKFSRPKSTGVLDREKLFNELDRARERPVVWIASPAGSGKTTLVSSYLDARKLKCLWYQVDEGDNDIATFFYYMGLAGKKANPRKRKALPLLTPEYMAGIPTFARRFFEELFRRLPPPSVVVLDNYQEVAEDSPLHDIIRQGLTVLPSGITVIVISRTLPPPAITPLLVARSLSNLGWPQLRLERSELAEFAAMIGKKELSADVVQLLHAKTDGWIAGLILMLERLNAVAIETMSFSGKPPKEIFEYFAVEIFNRLDMATQNFLLKTALLPTVTIHVAREITGAQNAEQILSSLHRHHFFTDKRQGSEIVYQYHPLFREFLLDKARQRIVADELNSIRQNSARLLEEEGRHEEAAELFREAGDWPGLCKLVIRNASELVSLGRSKSLAAWIMALPAEIIESEPWLLFWMGQCLLYFNPKESTAYFEKAFRLFCDRREVPGLYLAWCGILDSIEYGFESLSPLAKWVKVYDELIRKYGAVPEGDIEFRVTASMVTALIMIMPEHPGIESWMAKALSMIEYSRNENIKAHILFHCVFYYAIQGDFPSVGVLARTLKEMASRSDAAPFVRIVSQWAKAINFLIAGQFYECYQAVSDGLQIAAFSGVHIFDFMLMGQSIMSALNKSEFQQADLHLAIMGKLVASVSKWDKAYYYFLLAWKAFLQEDVPGAMNYADKAYKLAFEVDVTESNFLCSLEKAFVLHAAGNFEQADEYLKDAYGFARRFKGKFFEFACYLTEAYFLLLAKREVEGFKALRNGMAMGRGNGYLITYMWYPAMMNFLCMKALEQGIEVKYVKEMIRYNNLMPATLPSHLDNWPWPVKVYTLGRFSVEVDGEPLVFSGKSQKKPLEMLQAIIAFGGQDVSDERVAEALWPDSDGDMAMQSCRTTISRLRRLLRHENAIATGTGKIGLDRRYVWTDIWAFDHGVEDAWQGNGEKSAGDATLNAQFKVLERYPGEFLPSCNYPWAMPMRERLRNRYLNAVMNIGERLETAGEMEWAIKYYRKGLEVDNLLEGLYQRLIFCYGELGRGAEAARIYNVCVKNLLAGLGIKPSCKTRELLKQYVTNPV